MGGWGPTWRQCVHTGGDAVLGVATAEDIATGSGTRHLPLCAGLHRPWEWQATGAARIHRARATGGLFGQSGVPARADADQAQGRPTGTTTRDTRQLRTAFHAV